jgi:hypothetical protein
MKDALTETDPKKGEIAVNYIEDQDSLYKIALKARNEDVSFYATMKITNPVLLAKIESLGTSAYVRDAATGMLTRQGIEAVENMPLSKRDTLLKIALGTKYETVAAAAVKKIYNPAMLAEIALENQFSSIRKAALVKLTGAGVPESMAAEKADNNVILINKLIKAFNKVPLEHQIRLMDRTIWIIQFLNEPEVLDITGKILDIEAGWESTSQAYTETLNGKSTGYSGTKPGETFHCTIRVEKLAKPLSNSWTTNFSNDGGGRYNVNQFGPAVIDIDDIVTPVLKYLPQAALKRIYEKYEGYTLQHIIIQYISDLSMLKKISDGERKANGTTSLGIAAEKRYNAILAASPR